MSRNIEERYSERLVLRVNELYHDLTSEQYRSAIQPEMLITEGERWRKAWESFIPQKSDMVMLDIGTGTGFVPLSLFEQYEDDCRVVCSDVSSEMLNVAKENIEARSPKFRTEFVKLDAISPFRLPFEDNEFDVVTMNSVLHHLKETDEFLAEVDRVLKPTGVLCIGHEPNRRFRESKFLWYNFQLARLFFLPKEGLTLLLQKLGLFRPLLRLYYGIRSDKKSEANSIAKKINDVLLEEKIVDRPLRLEEIPEITDIRDRGGFDPELILPNHSMVDLESYNYLLTINMNLPDNALVNKYSTVLQKRFPGKGGTFFAVYKSSEVKA